MLTAQEIFARSFGAVFQMRATAASGEIGTGTAFKSLGHLITCAHNLAPVPLTLSCASPPYYDAKQVLALDEWQGQVRGYSAENSYDYAIIELPRGSGSLGGMA